MNDDWSRCPICFEDYSLDHRPTTFICGHSTCIDHISGIRRIRECPICRHRLRDNDEYNVSYNLEEACRIFQLIKNTVDWSTVNLAPAPVGRVNASESQTTTSSTLQNDENYARQLQARINRFDLETRRAPQILQAPNPQQPQPQIATPTPTVNRHMGQQKNCRHACCLTTTTRCCSCSDRRPHGQYPIYVDGHGTQFTASRNQHYCPVCKSRT